MKYLCLDYDNCGYFHYFEDQDYIDDDFSKTINLCPKCDYFMITVPDDFSLDSSKKLIEQASKKIFKSLNKQTNKD